MTVEQLELLAVTPTALPPPQQAVYDALHSCGYEGLSADEAGAIAHATKASQWAHSPDDRCAYCARDGHAILRALEAKGLTTYRRKRRNVPGAWILTGTEAPAPEPAPTKPGVVPYNTFPEGY